MQYILIRKLNTSNNILRFFEINQFFWFNFY